MRKNVRQELAEMPLDELIELRDLHDAGTWIPFNYHYVLDAIDEKLEQEETI